MFLSKNLKSNIDLLESFEKQLNEVSNDGLKEIAKRTEEVTEENKKYRKSIQNLEKEKQDILKVDKEINAQQKESEKLIKQRAKLEQQLANVVSGQTDDLQKLKLEISEANKQSKLRAKESLGLIDAYQKESMRLNDLRKQYKALAAEEKDTTEEAQKLEKEITQLDAKLKKIDKTVGQNFRSVGDYENATKDLRQEFGRVSNSIGNLEQGFGDLNGKLDVIKITSAADAFASLATALKSTEEGSEATERNLSKAETVVDTFTGKVGKLLTGFGADVITAFDPKRQEEFTKALADNQAAGLGFFDAYNKALDDVNSTTKEAINDFEGLGDQIDENIKKTDEITSKTIPFRKALLELNTEIAKQEQALEKLEVQRDAETRTLEEREELARQAIETEQNLSRLLVSRAQQEQEIAKLQLELAEQTGVGVLAARQEFAEKNIALIEAVGQAQTRGLQNEQELQTLLDDIIEQQLDIIIDGVDNIKAVNERRLADDRTTLAERRKILEETERLQAEAIEKEIALIQQSAKERIDIDKILALNSAEAIDRERERVGLSERLFNRLREITIEQRNALQDLQEAQQDLDDLEFDETRQQERIKFQEQEIELLKDKLKTTEEIVEETEKLNKEQTQAQIDLIDAELENLEKGSTRYLELIEERNSLEIDLLKQKVEDEKQIKDQAAIDDAEREQRALARQNAVLRGFEQVAQDRIDSIIAQSAATAFLNALQQGKSPEEAAADASNAAITAAIVKTFTNGFREGGYTGDVGVNDVAGVVHGKEHVNTAEQTARYNMRGWSASDFDRAVENDYFSQFANVDREFNQSVNYIQPQVVNQAPQLSEEKIGKEVARNMPDFNASWNKLGHLVMETRQDKRLKRTIHKSMDKPVIG